MSRSTIDGSTARAALNRPVRFSRIISSHCCSGRLRSQGPGTDASVRADNVVRPELRRTTERVLGAMPHRRARHGWLPTFDDWSDTTSLLIREAERKSTLAGRGASSSTPFTASLQRRAASVKDGGCFINQRHWCQATTTWRASVNGRVRRAPEGLRGIRAIDLSRRGPGLLGLDHKQFLVRHLCETASTTNDSYESANVTAGRFRFGPTEQEPTSRLGSGALVLPVISRAAAARPQGPRDISWLPARGRAVLDNLGHATATRHRDRSQFEGVVRLRAVRGRNRSDTVAGPA